ncbi:glucose-methanol-choline oxidoreductase [Flavobacteria bacterium MS024-3C]|jgi:choline dehydrogenase-like flavoprotein|nr:glucose-methanol-choline oxidoreductase [Flavobacteria bacterium MS024-3C]KRO80664.1 MAG: GMC family oxidoreductase [Polaribacter sp. BACL8 MAG-120531-bin13]MBT4839538.1 GMC family oxidoreductase [Flavobacteriaceae bacterium]MBT5394437.1 GMC family oxidoreductase [Flavobacteriaceae bacterium]MBT5921251.1 GMC family oxidoreductase [Flavobacteriaceae bacterium]|tara:strand:- start:19381 stop:21099 length:1719 start_codon:yes stop_codon:yes gene_type:complete
MQIKESSKIYDAVIVGSGAGGGMATKILSEAGLNIAVVEAGPHFDPANPDQQTQMKWPWESPRRGANTQRTFGDFDALYGGWDIPGEPYTRKDGTKFDWFRARMLGGRTNHWGRISLRFSERDFKHKDVDGLGDNWPIGYEDVKPYYDKVDKLIGLFGSKENLPNEPDGFFLPPPKPRLHELFYIKGARKSNIPVIPSRMSMLTKKINPERGVCFYCGQCNRSCSAYADFSAGSCLIFPAQKNGGQIDLYNNAMVREVLTNSEGKATGISYIDKADRKEYTLRAKVVVLAASACSSARILLNSKSPQHPNGLGNSGNTVGKYLHDSTGSGRSAFVPDLVNRKMYNEDGVGGMHVYTPWWLDNKKLDFPRGYHIEVWGGMGMPNYGFGFNANEYNKFFGLKVGGYGNSLRSDVKKYYGSVVGFGGRGESIAMEDNYCEIDPSVVDQFGIPVLRFHYNWSDFERKQAKHMHETFDELIHNMGGEALSAAPGADREYGLEAPGRIIHEVGTTRMGNDPKTSVVNQFQQLHDANNVFIVDAGPFVSQADKNPTWTILALSWRTCDYIVEQLKMQNI